MIIRRILACARYLNKPRNSNLNLDFTHVGEVLDSLTQVDPKNRPAYAHRSGQVPSDGLSCTLGISSLSHDRDARGISIGP